MSDLKGVNYMLENKDYPIAELEELIKTTGKQNIDRKLQRLNIKFSSSGYANRRIYTITHIPDDPFKIYAVIKLGIPAQANFTKIRNLYYLLFCAEGFSEAPLIEMERLMEAEGIPMARQTITKWINYLQHIDYITLSSGEFKYYVIRKLLLGKREYKEIDAETYKKGWAIYHHYKYIEGSQMAYSRMYNSIGGHPYKKPLIIENAILQKEIDELIEVVNESILENPL